MSHTELGWPNDYPDSDPDQPWNYRSKSDKDTRSYAERKSDWLEKRMAKGDAKRERQRQQKEFEERIALLIGHTPADIEETRKVVRYIEVWWGDGLSGAKSLIRTLAYIKENGLGELDA